MLSLHTFAQLPDTTLFEARLHVEGNDNTVRLPEHQMESDPTAEMHGVFTLIDSLVANGTVDARRVYLCGIYARTLPMAV